MTTTDRNIPWVRVRPGRDTVKGDTLVRDGKPYATVLDFEQLPVTFGLPKRLLCWMVWRVWWVAMSLATCCALLLVEAHGHTQGTTPVVWFITEHRIACVWAAGAAATWCVIVIISRLWVANPYGHIVARCAPLAAPKETTT